MATVLNPYIYGSSVIGPPSYYGTATSSLTTTTTPVPLPSGVQSGDLIILFTEKVTVNLSVSGGSGGWTSLNVGPGNPGLTLVYKFLDSSDISGSLIASRTGGWWFTTSAVYRGVSSITTKGSAYNQNDTPTNITGFTPAPNNLVVSIFSGESLGSGSSVNVTPPSGFTQRSETYDDISSSYDLAFADNLSYSGGSIAWSNIPQLAVNGQIVFELT